MPGIYRYSVDMLKIHLKEVWETGIRSVIFFGVPDHKDACGSGAWDEHGAVQSALRMAKEYFPDLICIADICLCEYTDHGHCGIVRDGKILNDETLAYLSKAAVSCAGAGADIVAPSDMMDGRIGHMRRSLDEAGYEDTLIMAYSVKYASAFYGPFREAADSAPAFGDRKTYQMDWHNRREALKEVDMDLEEGADIIMVKPALSYMDIIRETRDRVNVPVAAYSVSGEYAMIKAAGAQGMIDEKAIIAETTTSIYRAGAEILITYFAKEIAEMIDEGRIG